jgi:hypothetical protein
MADRTEERRLTDEQLVEILDLLRSVDSVELKLTVPSSELRNTVANLGIDPVEAQPRQVYFFDTPDLALDKAGLVARARRIQGGRGDTVVKLRPVQPDDLPDEIRHSASFNVELDVLPGGFVCSGSMKGRTTAAEVKDAVGGALPLRKLFTKEQRQFYRKHAPAGLELDALVPLGPTFVLKASVEPLILERRVVAELWLYPDGSRIFELPTKSLPNEAFHVAAESRAYLIGNGITLGAAQQTKTRTALEFFSAQLQA